MLFFAEPKNQTEIVSRIEKVKSLLSSTDSISVSEKQGGSCERDEMVENGSVSISEEGIIAKTVKQKESADSVDVNNESVMAENEKAIDDVVRSESEETQFTNEATKDSISLSVIEVLIDYDEDAMQDDGPIKPNDAQFEIEDVEPPRRQNDSYVPLAMPSGSIAGKCLTTYISIALISCLILFWIHLSAVIALLPPQQVYTTGMTGEVMSATSSHTGYMQATSSAASFVVVATVTPTASNSSETNQEAESIEDSCSSFFTHVCWQF